MLFDGYPPPSSRRGKAASREKAPAHAGDASCMPLSAPEESRAPLSAMDTAANGGKTRSVIGSGTASFAGDVATLFGSPEAAYSLQHRTDPRPPSRLDGVAGSSESSTSSGPAQETERWRLVHHGSTGAPLRLDPGHEITLGRSRSSTLRIDHPQVSGIHAVVRLREGRVSVKDLSTNGTFVDGLELGRNQVVEDVPHGSVISLVLATLAVRGGGNERDAEGKDAVLPFLELGVGLG